jgi:threonyl-tRNA synthetase
VDVRNEKIGKKIREAELQKMPFMVIVGENEEKDSTVSVRRHQVGDMGVMTVEELCKAINQEVKESIQQFK